MNRLFKKNAVGALVVSFFILGTILGSMVFPTITSAQSTYQLLTPLPGPNNTSVQSVSVSDPVDPVKYVTQLAEILVSLGVVLAVFFIVYGGIVQMSTDNIENKKEGYAIIKRTMAGLLLLAFSYILINTINPNLLIDPFPQISSQTSIPSSASATSTTQTANVCYQLSYIDDSGNTQNETFTDSNSLSSCQEAAASIEDDASDVSNTNNIINNCSICASASQSPPTQPGNPTSSGWYFLVTDSSGNTVAHSNSYTDDNTCELQRQQYQPPAGQSLSAGNTCYNCTASSGSSDCQGQRTVTQSYTVPSQPGWYFTITQGANTVYQGTYGDSSTCQGALYAYVEANPGVPTSSSCTQQTLSNVSSDNTMYVLQYIKRNTAGQYVTLGGQVTSQPVTITNTYDTQQECAQQLTVEESSQNKVVLPACQASDSIGNNSDE